MSERMSNADIEDVLSSIRRLVSDDLRPGQAPAPQPLAAPARAAAVPRLVLTSALRVSPDPAPVAPPPEARDTLADRLAELEVLMAGQSPEFEEELAPPSPVPPGAPFGEGLTDNLPLASEIDGAATDTAETDVGAPYIDAGAEPEVEGPAAFAAMPAEAEVETEAEAEAEAEAGPEDLLLQDEVVLRALIRDVLREELQGVMGERVTRNLRKLIRAEIARALTARGIA
jgi:hypothetical protein